MYNRYQVLFILTFALIAFVIVAVLVYFAQVHPAQVETLNDCTREIVGNCTVIR